MPVLNEPICTEIVPNLWLGNHLSSTNLDFIKKHKVKAIVNATHNYPSNISKIKYMRVAVRNKPQYINKFRKHLPLTYKFINRNLDRNSSVLVHCKSGHRRSAIVVINYLMNKYNMNKKDAIEYVRSRRPTIFPSYTHLLKSF